MTDQEVHDAIREAVTSADIMLFMKGSPSAPQCGFSATVVQILDYLGIAYQTTDVLRDPEIRQGVKTYSEWPTFPQLYIKGEFVGGCDIVREMFQSGELVTFLNEKGIVTTVPAS